MVKININNDETIIPTLGFYKSKNDGKPILAIPCDTLIGEPYCVLTVSFGKFITKKNCSYLDINNVKDVINWLESVDAGRLLTDTYTSGYCYYPLFEFNESFLRKIDTYNIYDEYLKYYN